MPNICQVSSDYHRGSFPDRHEMGVVVYNGLKEHPEVFILTGEKKPPMTLEAFNDLLKESNLDYASFKQGGRAQKPAYVKANQKLLIALDGWAEYVEDTADGDENIIILSGFNVAYGSGKGEKQTRPGQPTVTPKKGESNTELGAECEVFGRGSFYGCIISEDVPLDSSTVLTADGQLQIPSGNTNRIIQKVDVHRKKTISGLTPGKNYYIYYYVSNSVGVGPLSVAAKIMCG